MVSLGDGYRDDGRRRRSGFSRSKGRGGARCIGPYLEGCWSIELGWRFPRLEQSSLGSRMGIG